MLYPCTVCVLRVCRTTTTTTKREWLRCGMLSGSCEMLAALVIIVDYTRANWDRSPTTYRRKHQNTDTDTHRHTNRQTTQPHIEARTIIQLHNSTWVECKIKSTRTVPPCSFIIMLKIQMLEQIVSSDSVAEQQRANQHQQRQQQQQQQQRPPVDQPPLGRQQQAQQQHPQHLNAEKSPKHGYVVVMHIWFKV